MKILLPMNANIKVCQYCSRQFIVARKDTKYCTHSCRQMAYITRKEVALNIQPAAVKPIITTEKKEGIIKRFLKLLW